MSMRGIRIRDGSSRLSARALAGAMGLGVIAVGLGQLSAHNYGPILIGGLLLAGFIVWAVPRPEAIIVVMFPVLVIPTPALPTGVAHVQLAVALITAGGATLLWFHRRARAAAPALHPLAVGALGLLVVAAIVQLGISRYAEPRALVQLALFWGRDS